VCSREAWIFLDSPPPPPPSHTHTHTHTHTVLRRTPVGISRHTTTDGNEGAGVPIGVTNLAAAEKNRYQSGVTNLASENYDTCTNLGLSIWLFGEIMLKSRILGVFWRIPTLTFFGNASWKCRFINGYLTHWVISYRFGNTPACHANSPTASACILRKFNFEFIPQYFNTKKLTTTPDSIHSSPLSLVSTSTHQQLNISTVQLTNAVPLQHTVISAPDINASDTTVAHN